MKRTPKSSVAVAVQLKPLVGRLSLFLLTAGALALIIFGKTHDTLTRNLRMAIADTVAPVVGMLAKPLDTVEGFTSWVHEMATLHSENQRLLQDNQRLQQWQTVATELGVENDKLRSLLRFAPTGDTSFTTAHIAVDMGSPYSRSALITSGILQGVRDNMAVISDAGLVGRIQEAGRQTSRVLLLTDMNSRIPVMAEHSRERAIAGGTGGDGLTLMYLPENSKVRVGEKIVTSGDGRVLPAGLPVGIVTRIEKGVPVVQPFADYYHLEYVSVVDYGM